MKIKSMSAFLIISAIFALSTNAQTSETEIQKLLAGDGTAKDYFGRSVSISGDQAIVGAHGDGDNGSLSGSAYVFERIGGVWTEVAKLIASDGARDDDFGRSVSLSGDQAIVGAVYHDDNGSNSGSAYMYKLFQTPAEVVQDLILDVEYFNLPGGLENAMVSKLERAIVSLENGLDDVATNQMYAFIHMVEAQRDKKIADELADEWIAAAQWIIDSIQSE